MMLLETAGRLAIARGWETPVPSADWRTNMDPVLRRCQDLIHYILCLFKTAGARYGGFHSLARDSFNGPILKTVGSSPFPVPGRSCLLETGFVAADRRLETGDLSSGEVVRQELALVRKSLSEHVVALFQR